MSARQQLHAAFRGGLLLALRAGQRIKGPRFGDPHLRAFRQQHFGCGPATDPVANDHDELPTKVRVHTVPPRARKSA